MRNILLLVHADSGGEARFQAALDITRALGGHLTCLEVTALPRVVLEPVLLSQDMLVIDAMAAAAGRIEERLEAEDVAWDWINTSDDVEPSLTDAARLADLIILPNPATAVAPPLTIAALARLLAQARRPVLLVPEGLERLPLETPSLVAWDGSIGAASALAAAIPLLQMSSGVTLLEVGRDNLDVPAEEAAAYLSRHGIRAEVARRPRGRRGAGEVIRRFAQERGFGYVVMGSFGRSPASESLFGGVTLTLIERSRLPLFLAR